MRERCFGPQMSQAVVDLPKPLEALSEDEIQRKQCIGRIMTYTLTCLTREFIDDGFEWLLPVIFSQSPTLCGLIHAHPLKNVPRLKSMEKQSERPPA